MIQAILTNKNPISCSSPFFPTHFSKTPNLSLSPPNPKPHFQIYRFAASSRPRIFPNLHAFRINDSFDNELYGASKNQVDTNDYGASYSSPNLDKFLSVIEFLSLASSAAISVYVALTTAGASSGGVLGSGKILVWQCVGLMSGACVGAVIRRRQWRRIYSAGDGFPGNSFSGVNLLGRVEKLEEDLRNSSTIVRVLSRQIEKLGIRVRGTGKTIKEQISETSLLAQKNSEVTQALSAQEDVLEKELGEIQKVLLAMQEQQQKQIDLILAVAKAAKLLENKYVLETPNLSIDD